ncbi:hypothetical protein [Maribellus sp. YY47]|uniref:hypothetical protein n=1 Tax=Maribellus sp. YY47 TaxID=2929486 RepID=UPI0020016D20|nr:hypothetical protein [Maribellus sp. YY47]MCK3684520.1 hypothetical protein [Maribellus sp. YY47]
MKSRRIILAVLMVFTFSMFTGGCRSAIFIRHSNPEIKTNAKGEIPPGQMKKLTGEKSAKKYAPGQRKKKNKDYRPR